jgi:hypothetical protein
MKELENYQMTFLKTLRCNTRLDPFYDEMISEKLEESAILKDIHK